MINYHIDQATIWNVSGWAFDSNAMHISVEVELCVNGQSILKQKAKRKRQKLKESKKHPTGEVGFSINLGDKIKGKQGDQLTVLINGQQVKKSELAIPQSKQSDKNDSIIVVGQGKSGTSKLTYVVRSGMVTNTKIHFEPKGIKGLPNLQMHRELVKDSPMINKSLYGPNQSVKFGAISQLYDRKIWILRDPRDRMISLMLYRWFKGHKPDPAKYQQALELVKQKEVNPESVDITQIWNLVYAPGMYEVKLKEEYTKLDNILSNLDSTWYILSYEDMVDGRLEELNKYLGFETSLDQEVPDKLNRVVRSKGYGNWKNWFTPSDVKFYQPILSEFVSKYCPQVNDWSLNENQLIDPKKGSLYMEKLFTGK